ncbi:hypothetical protein DIPPA_17158 [Diplonema papillatum]|nr:hypothetical protein DIPPA_17158 [Diplonema papillatum]
MRISPEPLGHDAAVELPYYDPSLLPPDLAISLQKLYDGGGGIPLIYFVGRCSEMAGGFLPTDVIVVVTDAALYKATKSGEIQVSVALVDMVEVIRSDDAWIGIKEKKGLDLLLKPLSMRDCRALAHALTVLYRRASNGCELNTRGVNQRDTNIKSLLNVKKRRSASHFKIETHHGMSPLGGAPEGSFDQSTRSLSPSLSSTMMTAASPVAGMREVLGVDRQTQLPFLNPGVLNVAVMASLRKYHAGSAGVPPIFFIARFSELSGMLPAEVTLLVTDAGLYRASKKCEITRSMPVEDIQELLQSDDQWLGIKGKKGSDLLVKALKGSKDARRLVEVLSAVYKAVCNGAVLPVRPVSQKDCNIKSLLRLQSSKRLSMIMKVQTRDLASMLEAQPAAAMPMSPSPNSRASPVPGSPAGSRGQGRHVVASEGFPGPSMGRQSQWEESTMYSESGVDESEVVSSPAAEAAGAKRFSGTIGPRQPASTASDPRLSSRSSTSQQRAASQSGSPPTQPSTRRVPQPEKKEDKPPHAREEDPLLASNPEHEPKTSPATGRRPAANEPDAPARPRRAVPDPLQPPPSPRDTLSDAEKEQDVAAVNTRPPVNPPKAVKQPASPASSAGDDALARRVLQLEAQLVVVQAKAAEAEQSMRFVQQYAVARTDSFSGSPASPHGKTAGDHAAGSSLSARSSVQELTSLERGEPWSPHAASPSPKHRTPAPTPPAFESSAPPSDPPAAAAPQPAPKAPQQLGQRRLSTPTDNGPFIPHGAPVRVAEMGGKAEADEVPTLQDPPKRHGDEAGKRIPDGTTPPPPAKDSILAELQQRAAVCGKCNCEQQPLTPVSAYSGGDNAGPRPIGFDGSPTAYGLRSGFNVSMRACSAELSQPMFFSEPSRDPERTRSLYLRRVAQNKMLTGGSLVKPLKLTRSSRIVVVDSNFSRQRAAMKAISSLYITPVPCVTLADAISKHLHDRSCQAICLSTALLTSNPGLQHLLQSLRFRDAPMATIGLHTSETSQDTSLCPGTFDFLSTTSTLGDLLECLLAEG